MRKAARSALATVLALMLAVGVAGAREGIAVEPVNPLIAFSDLSFEGGLGLPVRCDVTIRMTLEAWSKTANALAGQAYVTFDTFNCTQGDAGILVGGRRVVDAQGPYHVTYDSFEGALPNITSITVRVNNIILWTSYRGIECLTNGAVDIAATTTGGNPITGMRIVAQSIPLTGGVLCLFSSAEVNGGGNVFPSILMSLL